MEFELPSSRHHVRDVLPSDEPGLLHLFEVSEDYFVADTGLPAGPGDVQSLLYGLPEGADVRDKQILVVEDPAGELVGLVDLVLHYPFTLTDPEDVPGARADRGTGPCEGAVLRAELRLDAA